MPVFFFDYDDGLVVLNDTIGSDLPDITAARAEVAQVVAEVAANAIPGSDGANVTVHVRDELGVTRLRASLVFTVETVTA